MILRPKVIKSLITYLTVYPSINIHAQFFSFHRKLMPIVSINIFDKKYYSHKGKGKKILIVILDWYLSTPYIYIILVTI